MIISIIVGGLLGATGGAIGTTIGRLIFPGAETSSRLPGVIGIVLAVAMTQPIVRWISKPSLKQEMANLEKAEPLYAAIREREPEAYRQIEAMMEQFRNAPGNPADFRAKIRGVVATVSARRLKTASDKLLLNLASVLADETKELGVTSPITCVQLLSPSGADISPYISADLKKRDAEMTESLITEEPTANPKMMTQPEVQAVTLPIITSISKDMSLSIQTVADALSGKGTLANRCLVNSELFRRLGRVPDNKGATVLRTLMAQN